MALAMARQRFPWARPVSPGNASRAAAVVSRQAARLPLSTVDTYRGDSTRRSHRLYQL